MIRGGGGKVEDEDGDGGQSSRDTEQEEQAGLETVVLRLVMYCSKVEIQISVKILA